MERIKTITQYLDEENFIARAWEDIKKEISMHKSPEFWQELQMKLNKWETENNTLNWFYDFISQRINGLPLYDYLKSRDRNFLIISAASSIFVLNVTPLQISIFRYNFIS